MMMGYCLIWVALHSVGLSCILKNCMLALGVRKLLFKNVCVTDCNGNQRNKGYLLGKFLYCIQGLSQRSTRLLDGYSIKWTGKNKNK